MNSLFSPINTQNNEINMLFILFSDAQKFKTAFEDAKKIMEEKLSKPKGWLILICYDINDINAGSYM